MSNPVLFKECYVPFSELQEEVLKLKRNIIEQSKIEQAKLNLKETTESSLYSVLNLINYVVMRRNELHPLQSNLARAGISSLGRVEPHVMSNIDSVLNILSILNTCESYEQNNLYCIDYDGGYKQLRLRAEKLFGRPPEKRSEYIMVTMPSEVADSIELVESYLHAGMNCARINCAHDDDETWLKMIENIRKVAEKNNQDCRIFMDLAGHKIRTGHVYEITAHKQKSHKSAQEFPYVFNGDFIVLSKGSVIESEILKNFEPSNVVAVTCTYPPVIDKVEIGQSVWIDDGKIGTVVKAKNDHAILLQVRQVGPKGVHLKEEKGLNFPDTVMNLPTLSKKDCKDLKFVAKHSDMVGLSFTEEADDVLFLKDMLAELGHVNLPVLVKIETAKGVQNLPDIILNALAENMDLGVMIARGDLAVELGSVRMAEIQDEIIRLCESAHIPVIWATQVLESLAKKGTISRPEISDAAMSQRAECVMLNKGPYIAEAVKILSEVLQRMEGHQFKSHTHMRALHW